jgi:hypothetical protein
VVECGGLENRYTRKGIESSNLSLSAFESPFSLSGFCLFIVSPVAMSISQLPIWLVGVIAVLVSSGVAVSVMLIVQRYVNREDLHEAHDVAGFIYAVVGVIYAVVLAFVVVVVWEQFNDAEHYAQQEASHIGDIRRLAQAFPDSIQNRIEASTERYIRSVVVREWPRMAYGQEDSLTYLEMVSIWREVRGFRPSPQDAPYYQEIVSQLSAFNDARRDRILSSHAKIPPVMWGLLLLGGTIIVGFCYLFAAPKRWPQAITVGLLTAMIALTLTLIYALDHPFSGQVKVKPDAFQYLLDRSNVR